MIGLPRMPTGDGSPAPAEREKVERAFERGRERFVSTTAGWLGTLESECQRLESPRSAWLAYNAVSRWSDHERGGAKVRDRLHRNVLGKGATDKVAVYRQALELVGSGA